MKAKDTVKELSSEELLELTSLEQEGVMAERRQQAEISFKAGREHEINLSYGRELEVRQQGRKEVVEWVEDNSESGYIYEGTYEYNTGCDNQILTDLGDWQAKIKDWGL